MQRRIVLNTDIHITVALGLVRSTAVLRTCHFLPGNPSHLRAIHVAIYLGNMATTDPLDDNCILMEESQDLRQNRPTGVCYKYAKFLARFWYVMGLVVLVVVTVLAVVTFKVYDLPDFPDPSKGFEARGTLITSRLFSIDNLKRHADDLLVTDPSDDVQDENRRYAPSRTKRQASNRTYSGIKFCTSLWSSRGYSTMVFEAVDETNILTLDAIKSVCKAERRLVTSHPLYQANCLCHGEGNGECPTWSLGNYAALLANKTSCTEIEQEDVIRLTDLLTLCAPFLSNWTQGHGNVPPECGQHDHAAFAILYYLLPTEFSQSIDSKTVAPRSLICAVLYPIDSGKDDVLETIYEESVERKATTDGITRLKAVDFSIKYKLFKKQLYADSVYMGISAGAIFLLIWLYTGSLLVSLAAFLNMMFSLVMADFFYTVVFVRPFFPFVNLIAVILMLGVGADDTFVYVDLWKKCLSELGDRDLPRLVYETLRHASVTMLVTSLTTAAALYATAFSHIIAVRCFAVFAGTAIIMNFVLTMTLLPAVVVMQHKLTALCCSLKICSGLRQCKGGCLEILSHRVKMIYEELIPSLVLKLRYAWIILFLLLMTGGAVVIFYFPRFRLPSSSDFQFFVSSHYFEQFDFVYRKQFSFSKETFSDSWGSVVWGVQAVDNGDMWDPDDRGTLALDDGFEFSSPEDQAWLLGFCQDLREAEFYTADTLDCFIEGFC
ncbi:protein dispatched homolog 1-like [Acanthaster planci]|uniref:Protein dispatched homolog 1-like n=1 Tax=Acanthaster planci TaxID=133434 RepID=A0A8B7YIE5_ACAPL|nr:protein dispatched homolog 1-like [Acanthaster planci]